MKKATLLAITIAITFASCTEAQKRTVRGSITVNRGASAVLRVTTYRAKTHPHFINGSIKATTVTSSKG